MVSGHDIDCLQYLKQVKEHAEDALKAGYHLTGIDTQSMLFPSLAVRRRFRRH